MISFREFLKIKLPGQRLNNDIPFRQWIWTFNSVFVWFHQLFCKTNPLLIYFFPQMNDRFYPFPCHRSSLINHFINRIRYLSVPMFFWYSLTSLNWIISAMVGWIINQTDFQFVFICWLSHSANKLSSPASRVRAVIQVNNQFLYIYISIFVFKPPHFYTICYKITSFKWSPEKYRKEPV